MNSFLLLLLFPTIASTGIISELWDLSSRDGDSCVQGRFKMLMCVQPHEKLIDSVMKELNSPQSNIFDLIYNIGFANKALQIARNISECMGPVSCGVPGTVQMILTYSDYIGTRVYGDAFHCFINAKTIETTVKCGEEDNKVWMTRFLENENSYSNFTTIMIECVAKKLYVTPSCSLERIVDLYEAGKAFGDAFWEFVKQFPDWQ